MGIYSFSDACSQLKQRIGNRNDINDAALAKYINQSQHVMATNVRGIDIFDTLHNLVLAPGGVSGYPITAAPPTGLGLDDFWAFETIMDTTEIQNRRRLWRGEWEMDLNLAWKPPGPPTLWFHKYGHLWFNTTNDKNRNLQIIYRRVPVLDTLEIPDEFFDPLISLACTFVYPTIGRTAEREALYAKLPSALQIAVVSPLSPSQWESLFDTNMAIYAEY